MKKYAVLLSGGINHSNNYERYENDLELAYRVLKEVGFYDDNILLFFGNGMKCIENVKVIPKAAKKEDIIDCFNKLAYQLNEEDELVLVVSNQGGMERGGTICLWENADIELSHLAEFLNNIKARKIVILGECYGGNILKYDILNSCIFTANEQGKPSYAHIIPSRKTFLYDEFIYHFFSYIAARYPDTGNRIPQGSNNLIEAYRYAKENDIFNPDNQRGIEIRINDERVVEIPQMKNNLTDAITIL